MAKSKKTRSSIAVSNTTVCEDEACIGKVADTDQVQSNDAVPQDTTEKEAHRSNTSMSIGGQDACSDDACIGKK